MAPAAAPEEVSEIYDFDEVYGEYSPQGEGASELQYPDVYDQQDFVNADYSEQTEYPSDSYAQQYYGTNDEQEGNYDEEDYHYPIDDTAQELENYKQPNDAEQVNDSYPMANNAQQNDGYSEQVNDSYPMANNAQQNDGYSEQVNDSYPIENNTRQNDGYSEQVNDSYPMANNAQPNDGYSEQVNDSYPMANNEQPNDGYSEQVNDSYPMANNAQPNDGYSEQVNDSYPNENNTQPNDGYSEEVNDSYPMANNAQPNDGYSEQVNDSYLNENNAQQNDGYSEQVNDPIENNTQPNDGYSEQVNDSYPMANNAQQNDGYSEQVNDPIENNEQPNDGYSEQVNDSYPIETASNFNLEINRLDSSHSEEAAISPLSQPSATVHQQQQHHSFENVPEVNKPTKTFTRCCYPRIKIAPNETTHNGHYFDGGGETKKKKLDTFALEECGWFQSVTEDGFEYWTNQTTGESRWSQFMDDVLASIEKDEGLGEIGTPEDFTESTWVPPSIIIAERRGNENSFGLGIAPLCQTEVEEFQVFGAGVRLYFMFVKSLGILFSLLSIISIPCFLLCIRGHGSAEEDKDALGIYKYTLANVGAGQQRENGLFDNHIDWLGNEYKINEVGFVLSIFVILSSLVNLLAWLWFHKFTTKVIQESLQDVVSIQDYSVFVTNVPTDITGENLKNFFTKLYDVHGGDWKDRDLEQLQLQHAMLYGEERTDFRVLTSVHEQQNKDQYSKVDINESALAEIQLVFSDAESIGTFLNRQKEAERLKRTRAVAKMFADDTPLKQGPDEQKHEKALQTELTLTYKMSQLADNLEKQHKLQIEDLDCIGAFLIFNSAIAAERLLEDHQEIKYEKYKPMLMCRNIPDAMYFEDSDEEEPVLFNTRKAPPPEDILWENVHFLQKPKERFIRQLSTGLVTFCLLAISTLIVGFADGLSREASSKLPDLTLCPISAKQPYLKNNVTEAKCDEIQSYHLQRPKIRSTERKEYDKICHNIKKNSFFVIYDNSRDINNYLNESSLIRYANISNMTEISSSCSHHCPYEVELKCPCIGVYEKTFKNCEIGVFDEDTCIQTTSESTRTNSNVDDDKSMFDEVAMKGSLTSSCYCFNLMNENILTYGLFKGFIKSYNTDFDLCTPVFEIFALEPVFRMIVSMTTAIVNILLASHIKKSSKSEGHTILSELEMNLFLRMFLAQIVNTILVPLVVSGKPRQGWPLSILGNIFNGEFIDFIYTTQDGRVERGWFTNVGNGFVITFALIAFIDIVNPMFEYYLFVRKQSKTRQRFEIYSKKNENLKKTYFSQFLNYICCCFSFLITKKKIFKIKPENEDGDSIDSDQDDDDEAALAQDDKFPMQSDLDLIFMAPPFELTHKYVHILTLSFLALFFGTGIPILYPMTAIGSFFIYWCDKFLLLRYNTRPEAKLDRQLQDSVNRYWGLGVILHLLFSLWMLSNNIFSKQIEYGWFFIRIATVVLPDNGKLKFEASRLPFYFACLMIVIILVLPSSVTHHGNLITQLKKILKKEKTEKQPMKAALFTEEYYREMSPGYVLPEQDKAKGWKFDELKCVRYKESPDGRILKTWEVIRENGLSTYWRGLHPKYREATKALEERLTMMEETHFDDVSIGSSVGSEMMETSSQVAHDDGDGSDSDVKIVMG